MRKTVVVFLCCFMSLCSLQAIEQKDLPEPYRSIHLMPFNPHGWYLNNETVERLMKENNIRTVIEVGSWMGASTRHMASLLPPGGKLYAVDTWLGSPNEQHDAAILATLYEQFLSNIIHAGLTDKIVPCRMDSLEAAAKLDVKADFIYIDATHEYTAVLNDVRAWYPHLNPGGILCGDDWSLGDHCVERAVSRFAQENNLQCYTNGWFWYIKTAE